MKTTRTTLTLAGAVGALALASASTALAGSERGDSIRIAAAPRAGAGEHQRSVRSETTSRVDDTEVKVIRENGSTRIYFNGKELPAEALKGGWTDKETGLRLERDGGSMTVLRGDEPIMSIAADGSGVISGDRMRLRRDDVLRMRELLQKGGESGLAEAYRLAEGNAPFPPPPVMLGVTLEPLSAAVDVEVDVEDEEGATVIRRVFKGLPADLAGLHEMDVIVEIEGSDEAGPTALRKTLAEKQPGQTLKLKVLRDGKPQDLVVDLAPYDAEKMGAPRAWAWNVGGDNFFSDEGRQRVEELQKSLVESSARMAELQAQLLKQSGRDSEQSAQLMAELATKMSAISSELARRSAELATPDVSRFLLERDGQGGRAYGFPGGAPLRFRTNPDGSQAIVVAPDVPEPPAALDPDGSSSDRMDALNARLERLERLLEKLVDEQE